MLRLTRDQLADSAQVAVATLADFETGRRQPHPRTIAAIRTALESAGVEFIPENGGGAGVRLRKGGCSMR
jgi:transcriptional regulator with XRE-family HTH domain